MDRIDRVLKTDKITPAFLKPHRTEVEFSEYINENQIKDYKEKNSDDREENEKPKTKKYLPKNIKIKINDIITILENAINRYNEKLDDRKISCFVYYEISEDNNIIINISNTKTGELFHRHTLCIECVNTEDDYMKLIDDIVKDRGLLLDYKA